MIAGKELVPVSQIERLKAEQVNHTKVLKSLLDKSNPIARLRFIPAGWRGEGFESANDLWRAIKTN